MALVAPEPPAPLTVGAHFVVSHGGSESNVAVSLARLGSVVLWCSRLGDDALGHRVLAEISRTGVGTELVELDPTARTGVYFKDPGPESTRVYYYRDGSAASRMDERDVHRALSVHPRILHLSGITPALSSSCLRAIECAIGLSHQVGAKVSFDINYRPPLWPSPATAALELKRLSQTCDIVFVGLDEAQALWDAKSVAAVRDVLDGAPVLVIKDGGRYASSIEAGELCQVPALPVKVIEPVGAGDAFAAGWLRGYLLGMNAGERLRLGHLLAAGALSSATDHSLVFPAGRALEEQARTGEPWRAPSPSSVGSRETR